MKKFAAIMSMLLLCAAAGAQKLTFMPQWTPQAQFAGYYMALEKGFYADEGLDVTIEHVSATSAKSALQNVIDGTVQIGMAQLLQAIVARSEGARVLDVLQTSQNCSLMCVSQNALPALKEIDGKRVGRWRSGFGEVADMFCKDFGVQPQWIYFLNGVNLFVSKAIDATLCYSYSEYLSLLFAKGVIPEENIVSFSDLGYNYPEDAVFVMEDYYNKNKDTVDKFVAASKLGWEYARTHIDETLDVVMRYVADGHVYTNRTFQKMMLEEVLRLQVGKESGKADFAPVSEATFAELQSYLSMFGFIGNLVNYKDIIR